MHAGMRPGEKTYEAALVAREVSTLTFLGIEEATMAQNEKRCYGRVVGVKGRKRNVAIAAEDTVPHVYKAYEKEKNAVTRTKWYSMKTTSNKHGTRSSASSVILLSKKRKLITKANAIKLQ